MFFFLDSTILLLIPGLILTLWAQHKVKSAFDKYSRVRAHSGMTAAQAARKLLDSSGLRGVPVERTRGHLSDHYDPRSSTLRLSESVYDSQSIAALGIAAHEAGHAVQHAEQYSALKLRGAIAPAAATGSKLGIWLFIIGLIFAGNVGWLMDMGIYLFSIAVVFTLITLPVEFNASKRAILVLEKGGYLTTDEIPKAKAVLDAAALTYVAAAATAVLTLVRLLILRGRR